MKYSALFTIVVLGLLLGGCAHEAMYADREYGVANSDAFDQQIVNKDYKYAGKPVEGLDGIYAEQIMGKYLDTYKEGFKKENIDITETGFAGSD
jgi:hypothetical protein